MNQSQRVYLQTPPKARTLFTTLTVMAVICATLLAGVHFGSAPIIEKNQQQLLQQSIQRLFPAGTQFQAYATDAMGVPQVMNGNITRAAFYAVFDRDKRLLGFAVQASGMGYQDSIRLLYAYNPRTQLIDGYVVLSSRETPGLGTKIETDAQFLAQFQSLPVPLDQAGTQLLHPITTAKKGKHSDAWQIDTITGATISSRSVIKTLSRSNQEWIPILAALSTTITFQDTTGTGTP